MGGTLKKKLGQNYRRGNKQVNCGRCRHFVAQWPVHTMNGVFLANEPRCRILMLQKSRRYRVRPNQVCDVYEVA